MRILCVYIPHFQVQAERLKRPELERRPVVVGGLPQERTCVVDCSEEAAGKGVFPSMPLREAHHLCPEAVFVESDEELSEELWEAVLHALGAVTLRMEPKGRGFVYLDVTKALRLYASEEYLASVIVEGTLRSFRLEAKAGVGNSRFVAEQAALCAPHGALVVPPGTEKEFIFSLSADRLPVDEKIKERLRLLGLHRLEKVAGLSGEALVSQFGSAGRCISEIVSGVDDKRQLPKMHRDVSLEKGAVSDTPFETVGQIAVALDNVFADISTELKHMGKLCRKVKLVLDLQDKKHIERTFALKNPTAEARDMSARIVDRLRDMTMESPVTGLTISVSNLCAGGMQEQLFRRKPRLSEKLQGVKGYLEAMYGHTPLFMVREGDAHSLLPERKFRFVEV